ncbi:hypothetical protein SDC9_94817 [bioreactor metagenome]|uniref:Uncharacterized protein n=1 Tax=bioreactor metagenome TaxID=1076179 RepID=A0A645A4H4_9ZZZZ
MSFQIVEVLEVVDIEHHHANGQSLPFRAAEFPLHRLLHVAAVVQTGQRVADGLLAERFF